MNRIKYTILMFVMGLTVCCQAPKKDRDSAKDHPLVGEWRNLTLKVEINKKGDEPAGLFEVDESTWEETLKIRPIRTYFRNDSTFNSEHYDLQDSLVLNPEGIWIAADGEVTMTTTKPFSDTTTCTYTIVDGIVTFGCWVDWDEDGEKDDWYLGTQKKY